MGASGTVDMSIPDFNHITGNPYSNKCMQIQKVRRNLPAWKHKDEFIEMVRKNQVTVLVGETGSGKTTQCGQFLLEPSAGIVGDGCMIACTQPRRVAAMSVAARVADEMDVTLGKEVGYTIRFEDKSSPQTILKFLTDGMLLREAMFDPLLSRYSVIMLDEAHERTLNTDLLLGLLKTVMVRRPDLKIVVMSATLEAERFQKFFAPADKNAPSVPLLQISGRTYPVTLCYSMKPERKYLEAAVRTVVDIHETEPEGDVLLFLTGEEEIEMACAEIREKCELLPKAGPVKVVPLYSTLPPRLQQKIFEDAPVNRDPNGRPGRKIVVSTNLAETSITIDGIVYVVDPGFTKQKLYDPRTRVESLTVTPISQASANQRKGRAGRTRPGKCFRLYTEETFDSLDAQTHPEMTRSSTKSVCMQLFKLGIKDIVHFPYLDAPAPETLMRSLHELHLLGAISDEFDFTPLGSWMAELPIEVELARMIWASLQMGCAEEVLTIAAMLSSPPPFMRPRDEQKAADEAHSRFAHPSGDHMTLYNVYDAYVATDPAQRADFCRDNYLNPRTLASVENVRSQLHRMVSKAHPVRSAAKLPNLVDLVKACLVEGYFLHSAFLTVKGVYKTLQDANVATKYPGSSLDNNPKFLIYHELAFTKELYLRTVTAFHRADLFFKHAPHYFDLEDQETFKPGDEATVELKRQYESWAKSIKNGGK